MDIKVPWIYTLICKFTSLSQACTGHLYHYHNQHPVAFCLCCCLYCLLCSRCDRQKCHHLLNFEYDSGDILVCIIHVKNFDSHHNKACCHVWWFSCRKCTMNCIHIPLFTWKVSFELFILYFYSSFLVLLLHISFSTIPSCFLQHPWEDVYFHTSLYISQMLLQMVIVQSVSSFVFRGIRPHTKIIHRFSAYNSCNTQGSTVHRLSLRQAATRSFSL